MRTAFVAALVALGLALGAQPVRSQTPRETSMCADCHSEIASGKLKVLTHADTLSCLGCHHIGYTRDPEQSFQRRLDRCSECHQDVAPQHVGVTGGEVRDCASCHSIHGDHSVEEARQHMTSRCAACHESPHPEHAAGVEGSPGCVDCHTMHTGRAFEAADPAVFEACAGCHQTIHPTHANVEGVAECTACHSVAEPPAPGALPRAETCATCHEAVHPAHEGVQDTPTCFQCHDFVSDPPVAQSGTLMAERCGACHEAPLQQMQAGGHGAFLTTDTLRDLPNCLICHTAHVGMEEARARIQVTSAVQCMQCHGESSLAVRYGLPSMVKRSYADDFHGATVQFLMAEGGTMGGKDVMICSDCHGVHDVAPLGEKEVAAVCLRCHTEGDEKIAGAWLGHETPSLRHKPLIWLVRLFYFVLIPFMLTGLTLTIVFQLVDARRKGARVLKTEGMQRLLARLRGEKREPVETVERFTRMERIEHASSALTFIALVITGLPQTRPDLAIAQWIISSMGGIWPTRLIHRTIGVIFVVLMLAHVTRAVVKALQQNRLPVMVPIRKDFEDVLQTFRHFLLGEPMPKVGKFDFSEKFEYWGLFLGGVVMSSTGVILLFPELVTQVLPGVIVAATRIMHGMEATFAVMVVILWHSWGVILRPDVFPLDTSIFTGRMSVHRLKHEHTAEYERLFPDRKADHHGEGSGD
ncbi:MAG: cytochrome b/b6 domain-containing protein [Longimicrobiales bacterium]